MDSTPGQAESAAERRDCPNGDAPAGRAATAGRDRRELPHPHFVLVSALREELEVPVPASRGPGHSWKQGGRSRPCRAPLGAANKNRARPYAGRPAEAGGPAPSSPAHAVGGASMGGVKPC